ncbi:nitrate- and nitrite sensing domain-containing protein [Streptomyces sp. NPDC052682]|uniref:sensor histidine kinase n=1 Tax=Streptomyces sp. NPDC052682 TaxID=3154954 RepID=UPI003448AA83
MSPRTRARRRLGSIRLSLVLLALVPSVTLAAMWGVTTIQMFSEGLRLRDQTELSRSTGAMGTDATLQLQRERSLSAAWLASPRGSRAALDAQRRRTDAAVAKLVGQADAIEKAPSRVSDRLYSVLGAVGSLEYYRDQVDRPTDITAEQALDQYTSIIDDQIHAFQELSQVDDGDLTSEAGPLVALEHAAELVSRENARLTLAWHAGHLDDRAWTDFSELVSTRRWLVQDQILPALHGGAKTQTERILRSPQWQELQKIEDEVLAARATDRGGVIALPDRHRQWDAAISRLSAQYEDLIRQQTGALLDRSADKADSLLIKAGALSAAGLVALLLCVGMSWRITRSLSRRLRGLRMATLSLAEERLPDVVARLERGEQVDAESATTPLDYGDDELGQVAQAFNTAQRTAVLSAIELADTRRGFQKIILGIARQSQNLVNLQLSKLDALERRHTDPDVLKGLYELDSTASQLRRYEENLVIVSGERPGRSWSRPVALIDILRSAVGEVAEYQRVEVHTEEEVAIAPPAVADVIHLLAELIDNATVYSPAPSPVWVRAVMVAKGLAVEVEDRGLGMSEEDYASLNGSLAEPPKFDVVALADDLRLGMFVISQLAHRHGIAVTLRPSPYGGTTAIVLVPHDIVVRDAPDADAPDPQEVSGAADRRQAASTPELPRVPYTPETASAAETGGRPDTRNAADRPESAAGVPWGRKTAGTQEVTGAPDARKNAGTPQATGVPDARKTASTHEMTGTPDGQKTASTPEATGTPDARGAARTPESTGTPDTRETASPHEATGTPDARGAARTPESTGTPDTRETASPHEMTGTPDARQTAGTPRATGAPDAREVVEGERGEVAAAPRPAGPARESQFRARVPVRAAAVAAPVPRTDGLAPLPRRIPQTSLAAELREEPPPTPDDGFPDDFTAERAAASLACFQRGTLQARDDGDPPHGPGEAAIPQQAAGPVAPSTPPADR